MKSRGIIYFDFEDMSLSEIGDQEKKLKEIVAAMKLTTPTLVAADAKVKERRGEAGLDLDKFKFRTS